MAIIGLKFDWDMWKDFWLSHWRKVKSFFSHLSHLHHHGVNPERKILIGVDTYSGYEKGQTSFDGVAFRYKDGSVEYIKPHKDFQKDIEMLLNKDFHADQEHQKN